MASIFTYDPDPPRVSSPWIAPDDAPQQTPRASLAPSFVSDYGVTKLQAEPQEGPTEYKLHLLLRPRRAYTFMSTVGSRDLSPPKSAPILAASHQPRHERLKHLTTQLLWRLQQSSPFHASSSKELTTPRLLYDSFDLNTPIRLEALVPGLEESRGALYEIGVSDDGTLLGLTKDEMGESIATLRVMAASLGCNVDVVRMVIVGECEWVEPGELVNTAASNPRPDTRKGRLWVAETLVTPNLGLQSDHRQCEQADSNHSTDAWSSNSLDPAVISSRGSSPTPQLRVTLTGPTTSGKSTLLGTLSAGTLDNGRGKSRLSLLKHRHEMVSGVTSSIAQELIGYKHEQILNFAQGNIESWVDIHACAEDGRLVFVSDSGGHPRYRRTVLRGLMSWAPHWSVLCVAADAVKEVPAGVGATSSAQDILGPAAAEIDLVKAHLTLSLKLNVPMAIVITKLDLASKLSLQKTMVKVLTSIKEAGRTPKILQPDQRRHDELKQIPHEDQAKVQAFVDGLAESGSLKAQVPIVLTSAVKGTGMGLVHALLASLPLPPSPTSRESPSSPERPKSLFHVDDTFSLPNSYDTIASGSKARAGRGVVVSGHVRFGSLSVGDMIVVGPFQPVDEEARGLESAAGGRPSLGSCGLSISHPSSAELAKVAAKNAISASVMAGEWHKAHIVSIRNLRLPVRCLEANQAGSVGLVFDSESTTTVDDTHRIRRGMVLALPSQHMVDTGLSLQAASGFTAAFGDSGIHLLTVGPFVNVYFASVRAAARILHVSLHKSGKESNMGAADDLDDIFDLAEDHNDDRHASEPRRHRDNGIVTLELLHNREWMELGSKILLLEGGSQDRSGLEGHVGRVVEITE
ncbi:GTP-binding protein 2 [Ophiocordyceps sinensis CO18]|uniref:GTP-binding protein 2 n=1 Tax=Ophiocordyceps sinensis (strain Co18 / CGMCC 3.14243) TaxID=911162 RepID=T5A9F7_OPHSC|nr:GTP-binding protein 2 [Ophiocordyceps sinensis CO18]